MEEKIREIVSVFIKVPAEQIAAGTPIDRTALKSSILLHRMYARLEEEGVVVNDYAGIKVFGDLLQRQGDTRGAGGTEDTAARMVSIPVIRPRTGESTDSPGVGIDIEEVAAMLQVADLRKDAFYLANFTSAEMAYCILQADPYASLAGLFAVKEAIVKADGQFRNRPFQTIGIGHTAEGKPVFPGFSVSIAHAGGMAVAVAVRGAEGAAGAGSAAPMREPAANREAKPASTAWLNWIALLLAAAALLVALKH
ncbi:MAG TPA: 4'-phosphopantetheinyl transferase superfamily protein [Puia sp.]|jgi:phosphopantetheine--protein transferase-like protein|nr:4'-phosphopantetheinyl transferase superfamily protein [Puia sp.]